MIRQITLKTQEEMNIYMNPQRQRLLKTLDILAIPVTPKQLSAYLGISASAVTYHLKKLETLGVVEIERTELIRGITAKYYKRVPVMVNLGSGKEDDLETERIMLSDYYMNETWKGFKNYVRHIGEQNDERVTGDAMNSILYVTQAEAKQIKALIMEFYASHMEPAPDTVAWETAIIAFPHLMDRNKMTGG